MPVPVFGLLLVDVAKFVGWATTGLAVFGLLLLFVVGLLVAVFWMVVVGLVVLDWVVVGLVLLVVEEVGFAVF